MMQAGNFKKKDPLLVSCSSALTFLCIAQAANADVLQKSDFIDTNRPSFCQSAYVVPMGTIQLENGTLYQHFQHGLTYFDIPENEVRVGLIKGTELQMFTPNMILYNQSRSTFAGATGLQEVGLKHQFGFSPFKRLTTSVVGGVDIPTGSKLLTGTGVMRVFRLPYTIQLNQNWAFCGMQSIVVTQPHGNIQYQPFVMLTRALGSRASAFVEYAGFFQQNSHAPGQSIAHFGGVYKISKHNQVDIQWGFGMSKTAPAAFVGVGYSYRFDGLPWGNKKPEPKAQNSQPQQTPGQNTQTPPLH